MKYVIEYKPVGQYSLHPWVDTDDGNKTAKDVTALNSSTLYQFRVRAFSKVPGEWSKFVQAKTQGDGKRLEEIVHILSELICICSVWGEDMFCYMIIYHRMSLFLYAQYLMLNDNLFHQALSVSFRPPRALEDPERTSIICCGL